ncbi:MAG: hypothetical protein JNL74_14785 [Fibrobacteres bacterium]|nr:hypothetical protein [Fibrobacterota bacterium]
MELSILHRVAQIVATAKADQALGNNKQPVVSKRPVADVVNLSGTASSDEKTVAARLMAIADGEPERVQKVEALKAKVNSREYVMTPEMIDNIAERIAKTLL